LAFSFWNLYLKKKIGHELCEEINTQREKREILRITAERAADILNSSKCKYAIVKSTYFFPVVPNDVDILIFGRNQHYKSALKQLTDMYFDLVAEAPLEAMLHDKRGLHGDQLAKDPFDVDLYREIGAGHIRYMNKDKFLNHLSEIDSNNVKLGILDISGELALNIFHSIYPEKLFTLLLHYHILYTIKAMTQNHIDDFLKVCSDHWINRAAHIALSLAESIQELSFGESPSKLTLLREAFGKKLPIEIRKIPYSYPVRMILSCFWEKKSEVQFTKSALKQAIFMLNPKYARYVLAVLRERQRRDTY
jgi:hypothetical protein